MFPFLPLGFSLTFFILLFFLVLSIVILLFPLHHHLLLFLLLLLLFLLFLLLLLLLYLHQKSLAGNIMSSPPYSRCLHHTPLILHTHFLIADLCPLLHLVSPSNIHSLTHSLSLPRSQLIDTFLPSSLPHLNLHLPLVSPRPCIYLPAIISFSSSSSYPSFSFIPVSYHAHVSKTQCKNDVRVYTSWNFYKKRSLGFHVFKPFMYSSQLNLFSYLYFFSI